jgi:hypothetical protein
MLNPSLSRRQQAFLESEITRIHGLTRENRHQHYIDLASVFIWQYHRVPKADVASAEPLQLIGQILNRWHTAPSEQEQIEAAIYLQRVILIQQNILSESEKPPTIE